MQNTRDSGGRRDDDITLLFFFPVFHKCKTVNANELARLKVLHKLLNTIVCLAL